MTEIQRRSLELHNKILDENYFVDLYKRVLFQCGNIEDQTDEELIGMWNGFWEYLPDDKSIRRPPFFELCDLAEEIYD